MSARLIGVLAVCALMPLAGCTAQVEPAYVEASYVPPDVEVYPHTVYEGRVVYLVDGRWYYRNGPNWVYYRAEPTPLYRYRATVRSAPPARREVYRAPPARRERYERYDGRGRRFEPDVRSAPPAAPPAERVR